MCSKVKCPKCQKFTWSGCGRHVQEALKGVKNDDRCQCANTNMTNK